MAWNGPSYLIFVRASSGFVGWSVIVLKVCLGGGFPEESADFQGALLCSLFEQ